jgi:hypothetical protein
LQDEGKLHLPRTEEIAHYLHTLEQDRIDDTEYLPGSPR